MASKLHWQLPRLLSSEFWPVAGLIWHTILAIGDNFDRDGWYSYRRLAWPANFTGNFQDYAAENYFMCGSQEVCQDLFSTTPGGKNWATMKDFSMAHKYFEEIKDTGVLAIFPFGREENNIKASLATLPVNCALLSLLSPQLSSKAYF